MRRKSIREAEIENLLCRKKTSEDRWNRLMLDLNSGVKVDQSMIVHAMEQCNWADLALLQKGLREHLTSKENLPHGKSSSNSG